MRHFRLFCTLVGDLALEKGVLLLETTLDVYKRKLAYQVHREHRFINVSTDEVGQLFFIVFPALINIFFLSFFFFLEKPFHQKKERIHRKILRQYL